jgi:hypothetical protein
MLSAEVTWTVEDTTVKDVTVSCVEGYRCCMSVVKKMVLVKGTKQEYSRPVDPCNRDEQPKEPYELEAPATVADGSVQMDFAACIAEDSPNQVETDTLKKCPPE